MFGPIGGAPGNMTMRGSMPSFQAAQASPQWQQPLSLQSIMQMFPQFASQVPQPPQHGATAPNWTQYWPNAAGGPGGAGQPQPAQPAQPQPGDQGNKPTTPEELLQFLSYYGGAGSGGGGM